MNRLIFDTETISIEKAFCYNLGYVIINENGDTLKERNFVIKQIYDNKPLFNTSYYAKKRPLYVHYLKGRTAQRVFWGTACRRMAQDIKEFNITNVYAYNSNFDIKVFYFNHLFFRNKTRPLDSVKVNDIMALIPFTEEPSYKEFCKKNGFTLKNGRVQKTAESVYAYITNNPDYKEEHTALQDSRIEKDILLYGLKYIRETAEPILSRALD